mgnify:CR=1 FL=1
MKNSTFLLFFLILSFSSCDYFSKYPGYSKTNTGIFYQLFEIGEDTIKADYGDFITVHLTYRTMKDSLFFNGKRKFRLTPSTYHGSIEECFAMLYNGDSANFIINAERFFTKTLETDLPSFIKPGENMKVDIKMLDLKTAEEYKREKQEFLAWIEDFGEYERVVLKNYLEEKKLKITPLESGIYYLPVKKGNGKKVSKGDTITVHYEGKFLNGKYFDSTKDRKIPFEFVYGAEWQVIEGMEKAISVMEEGEKAIFIMPSELAFGVEGSSTGIIPPYTSLVFEVELLRVGKATDTSTVEQ